MIGRLLRLIGLLVVIGFFIYLFHPDFIRNAGNAFPGSLNHSNAYGSAQLIPDTQGKGNNLQVNLQGLSSNVHYVVALEEGGCGGTVIKSFGGNADTHGNANSLISLSDLASAAQQGLWVNVHRDTISGPSVACGQVQINKQLVSQAVSTAPTSTPIPVATRVPTTTHAPTSTVTTSDFVNDPTTARGTLNRVNAGFPQTGVAPAKSDSYENYTYPRKY